MHRERDPVIEFEAYVAARGAALLRYAYVLTGDAHRAEDLTQTALLKAFRHWNKVSRSREPDAYVRRILINASMDWWRRRTNHEAPTEDDPHRHSVGENSDPAERVEQRDEINRALNTLTAKQRAVLVLRHYEGMSDADIANFLGCGEINVRTHATRGRERLRAALAQSSLLSVHEGQL